MTSDIVLPSSSMSCTEGSPLKPDTAVLYGIENGMLMGT